VRALQKSKKSLTSESESTAATTERKALSEAKAPAAPAAAPAKAEPSAPAAAEEPGRLTEHLEDFEVTKSAELAVVPSGPTAEDAEAIRSGLKTTRGGFIARLASLFGGRTEIDPALLEEIEEILITADI